MKNKYNLSDEGVEKLMGRLTDIAMNDDGDAGDDFTGMPITSDFMKRMANVDNEMEVINNNEDLTKRFQGFINMYGFDNMYDMYMYALSCDAVDETLQKNKDYSKLVAEKRKVNRGGKQVEITVWVKPDGDEDGESSGSGDSKGGKGGKKPTKGYKNAKEMKAEVIEADLNEIAKLKSILESMPKGNKSFQEDSKFYLEIRDEGKIVGVIGYSEEGEYITMDFYRTTGEVAGIASKGFFELLMLSHEQGKGAKIEDEEQARQLFFQSGLEQNKDGDWVIEKDDLNEVVGLVPKKGAGKDE